MLVDDARREQMDDELTTPLRARAKQILKDPGYAPKDAAELLIRAAHEIERLRAENHNPLGSD
jgi:hypothetical protein